jgi:hypothetical protein
MRLELNPDLAVNSLFYESCLETLPVPFASNDQRCVLVGLSRTHFRATFIGFGFPFKANPDLWHSTLMIKETERLTSYPLLLLTQRLL